VHVFRHPNYYKKLKASQEKKAISSDGSTDPEERAPSNKPQAPSAKPQATSVKHQAGPGAGCKPQAPSNKAQASSRKQQAP